MYARSPSLSQRPAPTTIASRSRSRYVFAPVRPRLARWEYKGPRGTRGNGDISERLRGIRSNEIDLREGAKLSRHFLLFLLSI